MLTKYGDIFKFREKYVGSDLIYNSVCFTETKCQTITDRIISTHGATLLFLSDYVSSTVTFPLGLKLIFNLCIHSNKFDIGRSSLPYYRH